MQSHGLLPTRRSIDQVPRNDASSSNGDTIRNDRLRGERTTWENHHRRSYENREYERSQRSEQKKRVAHSNSTYPRNTRVNMSYVHRSNETEPRPSRRREYVADYDEGNTWRDVARDPRVSKPILRNGINHDGNERLYYSTIPRHSRTINFKDQACGDSLERRRPYPKSLHDLTDLKFDDATYLSCRGADGREQERPDNRRRRGNRRAGHYPPFDDDYIRLCSNLSRLDKYPRGGRYEPGQVHYERECRTFGKDTVAFIYYKTCYL